MSRKPPAVSPDHVRVVRAGHGANCSSIGSVIDTLFITAAFGGTVFVAIAAALSEEPVRAISGSRATPGRPGAPEPSSPEADGEEDSS